MKVKLYSVFDSKTATFGQPHCMLSDAAAIRTFSDNVNSPNENNAWFKHPEDYSLFYIGIFDDESAELERVFPVNLVTASALKSLSVPNSPLTVN